MGRAVIVVSGILLPCDGGVTPQFGHSVKACTPTKGAAGDDETRDGADHEATIRVPFRPLSQC